ncbi:hypothetical protein KUCAC02_015368, partial [Chaenocephalus aceratus]
AMGPKTETSAELRPDDELEKWVRGLKHTAGVKKKGFPTLNRGPSLQSLELGAVCERCVSGVSGLRQHGQRQGEEADQSKQPQKALQQITGPFPGLL